MANPENKGFSIIEIIISLFIVGLLFVMYQSSVNVLAINEFSKHREQALRIAHAKIEELRAVPFGSIPVSGSLEDPILDLLPAGSAELSVIDASGSLKQVTVTVFWQERKAAGGSKIELSTLISKNGI